MGRTYATKQKEQKGSRSEVTDDRLQTSVTAWNPEHGCAVREGMGHAPVLLHCRFSARRRSRALLFASALPTAAIATAGAAILLAIQLAFLVAQASADEGASPPDEVGWAELHDFLPPDATLEEAVGKIRRARIVTSEMIGYGGQSSAVYDASLRLARLASDEQLRALVSDPSPGSKRCRASR
jgi:hypothetical protein